MPSRVISACALLLLTAGLAGPTAAQNRTSPLLGTLRPGSYAVGFRVLSLRDRSRPSLPELREDGAIESGDRSRPIQVHVWYPASTAGTTPMTVADYVVSELETPVAAAVRSAREASLRNFLGQFGDPVTDDAWNGLLRTSLLADRDAVPAVGRFPLILGVLRPFSTTITNELLASHGFVVAMTFGPEVSTLDPGLGLEVGVRDMEFALPALRDLDFVDPVKLAMLGFSGSGFSQILFAMRNPDVDAVCDLESAIFDGRMMYPLARGWGYDVTAVRVPFLHMYSVPLSQLESAIGDFENMRYSTRYRYLVDAPGIHHWDFATEGMAASTVVRNRGPTGSRLQRVFETTNRYVLAFMSAYLKEDAAELAFLQRDPVDNGVPAGLATIRTLPAVEPGPSIVELEEIAATRGVPAALAAFDAGRRRDPESPIYPENQLNSMAYRVLRARSARDALPLFRKILELFPSSSNAHDSLAEVLETMGENVEALALSRRGLELIDAENDLAPNRRQLIRSALEDRVRRLGG